MESELRHRLQIVDKVQNWTRPHAGQRMESRPVSKVIKYSIGLCRTTIGCVAPVAGLAGKGDQSTHRKRANVVGGD
jgi:hypothetical protein